MRYFIQLSYNGSRYHGWQVQQNARSVQEEVEKALSLVTREKIGVTGAGRTDTGVHARYYIAHFDSEQTALGNDNILFKLNCLLPPDIAVRRIFAVRPDAHARFDATYREYQYYISRTKDPFSAEFSARENRDLDVEMMNQAAQTLLEVKDFTSFSKLGSDVKTNNCVVTKALWERTGDQLVFTIRADRFLRNMVRAIVGTLVEVGLGKMTLGQFRAVIEKKDRSSAGASMEAKGLFLVDIGYPVDTEMSDERESRIKDKG